MLVGACAALLLGALGLAFAGITVLLAIAPEHRLAAAAAMALVFLAAGAAFASVGVIVLRHDPHLAWTWTIMAGWVVGVAMQIIAGAIARWRR